MAVLIGFLTVVLIIAVVLAIFAGLGAIYYFALDVLGFDFTFWQAVAIVVLITLTGRLFSGNFGDEKEDE